MLLDEKIKRAQELRKSAMFSVVNLEDKEASEVASLYSGMEYSGALIEAGTRINHGGLLFKAAVDLWDTEENNPDNAPTLWVVLDYVNGVRKIPVTDNGIFAVTLAFAKNEEGYNTLDDCIYVSKVNGNVYTPEIVPDNWTLKTAK